MWLLRTRNFRKLTGRGWNSLRPTVVPGTHPLERASYFDEFLEVLESEGSKISLGWAKTSGLDTCAVSYLEEFCDTYQCTRRPDIRRYT